MEETLLHTPAGKQWLTIGERHHHGINLPIFSLHSKKSCGIGEYPDLLPLIPWVRSLGFDIIQLLPINDCGPDRSPYSALSAAALNPLHLGLARLPFLEQIPEAEEFLKKLQNLNGHQRLNYPAIQKARETFLLHYFHHIGPQIIASSDYQNFMGNYPWMSAYALFKAIKMERNWQPWEEWPQELQNPDTGELQHRYREMISYHSLLQYLCFNQMKEVKKTAEEAGLFIKGDIPILISRESAAVWQNRDLFLLQYEAGAPPDMYAKEGQKWGFPIYNWKALEESHYNWWKGRLEAAQQLYHLYRLDHIVGFFRIWAVPQNKSSREGSFIPPDPATWVPHGEKIMRMMLESCPMLPIGEDLGTVPLEVRACLKRLGICGTKVMRWERNWNGDRSFIPYRDYPQASMTTVSTHDSETLQLWWRSQPDEAREFSRFKNWQYQPTLTLDHHREILHDSHHTASLFHINLLNEYFPLVAGMSWPNLEDERINIPGVILDTNWTYRFRPSVEEIISSESLYNEMRGLVS